MMYSDWQKYLKHFVYVVVIYIVIMEYMKYIYML